MVVPRNESIPQLPLFFHPQKPVIVGFDAPEISSDGGFLLLRELDDALGLTAGFAAYLPDDRDPVRVVHDRHEQARQRIFQIAQGYEDCNDADRLRHDPLLKAVSDRLPQDPTGLSSQPTLSRFENAVNRRSLGRLVRWFERTYIDTLAQDKDVVILDIDATDDPTHGQQQLTFFHGYYDHYMYHPLMVYDGETGDLITVILRPGNRHASRGALGTLRRLIRKIRKRCPQAAIVVRGDSGFCVPKMLRGLERLDATLGNVDYLLGIAKNSRLGRALEPTMAEVRERQQGTQKEVRYTGFSYAARSWDRSRWVIGKAEVSWKGDNPRYVITTLRGFEPEAIYRAYCERGRCENWIKDFKNALKADRLSCSSFAANFLRLLLHAVAYRLMHTLRRLIAPHSEKLGKAQFDTLRLNLLRVAVQVTESVRRIVVRLPRAFPEAPLFRNLAARLALLPPARSATGPAAPS
jgi:hypothetical protein